MIFFLTCLQGIVPIEIYKNKFDAQGKVISDAVA